ncbi:hypothetical protein MHB48_06850 [Psychrobacillus sp. FSL H8-0483]|uniref:AlkZ-related protein n=1 Tax=Psychrobacillus sp. FSL H8-0483 TaxID=2921389 RepID=UPI00315AF472
MEYKVKTYEEAIKVVEEIGLLPLAPLIPGFPSLNSITSLDSWHSDTEFDPWIWRTKFPADGIAGYGKFMKNKSILVSLKLLPYVKKVLGYTESVKDRYVDGMVSKEAFTIYKLIIQEEGIDTRVLRKKSGLTHKDQKKIFENALLELQGTMDIVISGIQEKKNIEGETNGWNSTAFETYDSWASRNKIERIEMEKEAARDYLLDHFINVSSEESVKSLRKILS